MLTLLRNFSQKVWQYGNKVLSLQMIRKTRIRHRDYKIQDSGAKWHRDSLFFTPLRTTFNNYKKNELWLTCHKKATTNSWQN